MRVSYLIQKAKAFWNEQNFNRKRLIISLSFVSLVGVAAIFSYTYNFFQSATLTPPQVYWKLDEGTGTTINNSLGLGSTATLGTGASAPTWNTESKCVSGNCLYFDGLDAFVATGADSNLLRNTGEASVTLWVKKQNNGISFFDIAVGTGTSSRFELQFASTGALSLGARAGDAETFQQVTTTNTFQNNQWYFVTGTIDYAADTMKVYVDGLLQSTTGSAAFTATSTSDTSPLRVRLGTDSGTAPFFRGFMDEIKVYAYELSADEVKAEFIARGSAKGVSAQIGDPNNAQFSDGLIGHWTMDEFSANTCLTANDDSCDSSGNAYDGSWNGGVGSTSPGKYGRAVTFDGTDDYIEVEDTD